MRRHVKIVLYIPAISFLESAIDCNVSQGLCALAEVADLECVHLCLNGIFHDNNKNQFIIQVVCV